MTNFTIITDKNYKYFKTLDKLANSLIKAKSKFEFNEIIIKLEKLIKDKNGKRKN